MISEHQHVLPLVSTCAPFIHSPFLCKLQHAGHVALIAEQGLQACVCFFLAINRSTHLCRPMQAYLLISCHGGGGG
jgi:hypothetical protein